ncbi:MAG: maleylacetoacetate isomerase [Pseudomonadota bacterium]
MQQYTLYSYFRSSTSTRVRVALALKGIDYRYRAVSLLDGDQRGDDYLAVNPEGLVPALLTAGGDALAQSMAIVEYLDEVHPEPPLLPRGALGRARVRALAQIVGCDIHPLNNLRVLKYVKHELSAGDTGVADWFRHWASSGCAALEARLSSEPETGSFCHGDAPTMADICLYAQVLNNRRFDVDMRPFPTVTRVFETCAALAAFRDAAPEAQPDAR